jgi:hypothetical protein
VPLDSHQNGQNAGVLRPPRFGQVTIWQQEWSGVAEKCVRCAAFVYL